MSKYMGQIMAECDCQHQACEMRGYCMVDRIEELETDLQEAVSLLGFAVDMTGEPHCWHDHHGYCQAHNLQPAEECWVKRAADFVANLRGKNQ